MKFDNQSMELMNFSVQCEGTNDIQRSVKLIKFRRGELMKLNTQGVELTKSDAQWVELIVKCSTLETIEAWKQYN
jgi:hypothetical protein